MCHVHGWSLHCFSHTCWDKGRARSSAQPSVLRNDSKSNWLHATLSRQSRARGAAEEQVWWVTEPSVCLSSTFHADGLAVSVRKSNFFVLHLSAIWGLLQHIPRYNVFLKPAVDSLSLLMTRVFRQTFTSVQYRIASASSELSESSQKTSCLHYPTPQSVFPVSLSKYDPD